MQGKELNLAEPKQTLSMHPKKFALWLFIVSIVMLFAALTSAYIVKQSDGNWLTIDLPSIFLLNTIVIMISSLFMHLAYKAAKKDNLEQIKLYLGITTVLGILFLVGQYYSWSVLVEKNIYFVSNYASASFIYVFTGLHGAHLISGIIFLLITLGTAYKNKIHSRSLNLIEMCATYWHFLGGLWVYLYVFLELNS